jgi:hypothetical protein
MKHLMRSSLIGAMVAVSAALAALAVAPAAMANKPIRDVGPQEDTLVTDQCAFPVLAHIDGVEINTIFTDKAGNPVKQIVVFPGNTLTLTNLDTGKSITVGGTGSFQARAEPDGSVTFMVTGQGTLPNNPFTGEPGIWYLNGGRVVVTVDAEGNNTSAELTGNLVDLCPQLAS